jgi:DNA processing protein
MWEIKSCKKTDDQYPKDLKKHVESPETLYYVGDLSVCNRSAVAVIGKRNAKERSFQISYRIGSVLAKNNYSVLNGIAIGCDTYALEGALSNRGKVVAVFPCGLDEIYPKSNRALADTILKNGGCLISEYPCGTRPQKYMFLQRDRIQAMLADKVLVVDAEENGGTMYTAKYASKIKKPLGCFVERDETLTPKGNRFLVEKGDACAIYDTKELLSFLEQQEGEQMTLDEIM